MPTQARLRWSTRPPSPTSLTALSSLGRAATRSEPRIALFRCISHARAALDPLLDTSRLPLAVLEALLGIPEVLAHRLERRPEPVELLAQPAELLLDLAGVLVYTHPLEAVQDHQQIGVEGVGRYGNDAPAQRVTQDTLRISRIFRAQHRLVVHVLGRDVHQREVIGAFVGTDVLVGDLVDPLLEGAREGTGLALGFGPGRAEQPLARFEGKLRIHGHQAVADPEGRVHPLTGSKRMLHLVVGAGEDLSQQLLEPHLAERAAQLRDLEQLLHFGDGGAHRLEAFPRLAERPQPLLAVAQRACLVRAAPQE